MHEKECGHNAKIICSIGGEDVLQLLIKLILTKGVAAFCGARRDNELGATKALTFGNIDSLLLVQPEEAADSVLGPAMCRALAQFIGLGEDQLLDELVSAMSRLLPFVAKATSCIEEVVPGGGYTGCDIFGKIGAAIYPVKALVALSCSPNAIAFNVGTKSVLQVPHNSLCCVKFINYLYIAEKQLQNCYIVALIGFIINCFSDNVWAALWSFR